MKKKNCIGQNHYLQAAFPIPPGSWAQFRSNNNPNSLKRLFRRYQKVIDTTLATMAIGLMFLGGIWIFLVQLAEFGFTI